MVGAIVRCQGPLRIGLIGVLLVARESAGAKRRLTRANRRGRSEPGATRARKRAGREGCIARWGN